MILEEAPARSEAAREAGVAWAALPSVLSARERRGAARAGGARLLLAPERPHPELSLLDVAHSLATTRASFETRVVIVGVGARTACSRALAGAVCGPCACPPCAGALGQAKASGKLVFVFPGQGSQWLGMASELKASSAVFAEQLQACERALSPFVDWSLSEVLAASDEAALEGVDVVQPVLFAVMVSLAALWRSRGIEPDAVLGHSQGEIAAAYVAGALSLVGRGASWWRCGARALMRYRAVWAAWQRSSFRRSSCTRAWSASAVGFRSRRSTARTLRWCRAMRRRWTRCSRNCQRRTVLARRIRVDYASHCSQLEAIEAELLREPCRRIAPRPTQIPLYSTRAPASWWTARRWMERTGTRTGATRCASRKRWRVCWRAVTGSSWK